MIHRRSILATRAFYLTWHCHVAGKYAVNPLKSKWNIQRGHLGSSLARSRMHVMHACRRLSRAPLQSEPSAYAVWTARRTAAVHPCSASVCVHRFDRFMHAEPRHRHSRPAAGSREQATASASRWPLLRYAVLLRSAGYMHVRGGRSTT